MTEELLKRTFDVEITDVDGDGRTIHALCVPYNSPTQVNDGHGPYTEVFVKGAFARAVNAPNRVWLNFEHHPGFSNVIGNGIEFEERDDGLYGALEVDLSAEGDKALRFVNKRVLTGMSVEFKPMSRDKAVDGVVTRRSVHLDAVALCRVGAYAEAQVLAVRTESVGVPQPHDFDPELAAKLARFVSVPGVLARVTMPEGMDQMPDGVKACTANGRPGFTGGRVCHVHTGTQESMTAAMERAQSDALDAQGAST